MSRFRVREKYVLKGWTYITAESEEEAVKKLENGEGDFKEEYDEHLDTKWETLEEV